MKTTAQINEDNSNAAAAFEELVARQAPDSPKVVKLPVTEDAAPIVDIRLQLTTVDKESGQTNTNEYDGEDYLWIKAAQYLSTEEIDSYDKTKPILVGSLIRSIFADCALHQTPQCLQTIVDRVHSSVFNPQLPIGNQIALINRTLRAYLGVMPFDTMLSRVTLQDVVMEPGEWIGLFRKHIMPCLIQYEDYLNQPLQRQMGADIVESDQSASTIESDNTTQAEDIQPES